MSYTIIHDRTNKRFFAQLENNEEAELNYKLENKYDNQHVDFYRTFVPDAYRGKGIAEDMVTMGLKWAEQQGYKIDTSCWYAARVHANQN